MTRSILIWRIVRITVITIVVIIVIGIGYLAMFPVGQQPDKDYDVSVSRPAYPDRHPVVLFDEAHNNVHTSVGLYSPFANLIKNDGYEVKRNKEAFTAVLLSSADILIIVNASSLYNPKLFGINVVPLRKGERGVTAFTADEIAAIQAWVEKGGSLLLIADHYPFGSCAADLAEVFGVTMLKGFTEVPARYASPSDLGSVIYTRENGLLVDHPITRGRSTSEIINQVMSFTGQSLNSTSGTAILALPDSAVEYLPPPPDFQPGKAGAGQ